MDLENLRNKTIKIRERILKMHFKSKESHIGSALSIVDILAVLYFKILNIVLDTLALFHTFILN